MALPTSNSVIDGKYSLVQEIGSGVIGTVYEAEQIQGGPNVAIKLLHKEHCENHDLRERLLDDARAVTGLAHGNLVAVRDVQVGQDGQAYIVSELVHGENLEQLLERAGALPVGDACALMLQVLAGLSAVHATGLIHGSLKPSNILLSGDAQRRIVKLLDVGDGRTEIELDQGGELSAPAYLAPEQVLRLKTDARADLYAAAVILYKLVTGSEPFDGATQDALLEQIINGEWQPLGRAKPGIATSLTRCLESAMDKDPAYRPANAKDFATKLLPFAEAEAGLPRAGLPQLSPFPQLATTTSGDVIRVPLVREPVIREQRNRGYDRDFPSLNGGPLPSNTLTDSLLIHPRIPRAPSPPRIEMPMNDDDERDLASKSPRSWLSMAPALDSVALLPSPRLRAALLATAVGFGVGVVLAWLSGVF